MKFWCSHAWIAGGWQAQVLLECDAAGFWRRIEIGVPPEQAPDASRLGPTLPGLVNAHSHAFQRAMAGLGPGGSHNCTQCCSIHDSLPPP